MALMERLLPPPSSLGRPRETDLRAVVNAILYMASTGCQWRQLPKEFPPYSTVQGYFYEWSREGRFAAINHALVMAARETAGREASPTGGRHRQPVGENHGKRRPARLRRRQEDQGTQAPHRHRHAGQSGRSGRSSRRYPGSRRRPVALGFDPPTLPMAAPCLRRWRLCGRETARGVWRGSENGQLEIIKRSDSAKGFEVLPRRWVVERTFAWLGRCRRLAKDFEATIDSATAAWVMVAHIRTVTRRLARV